MQISQGGFSWWCWPQLQSVLSKSAVVVLSTATHTRTIHPCVVSVLMSLHPASPGFLSLGHVFSAFLLMVALPSSTVSGTSHKHLGMTVSVTGQLTVCSLLLGSQCYSFHGIFRHNCSMLSRFVFVCTKHKAAGCPEAFCKGIYTMTALLLMHWLLRTMLLCHPTYHYIDHGVWEGARGAWSILHKVSLSIHYQSSLFPAQIPAHDIDIINSLGFCVCSFCTVTAYSTGVDLLL